MAREQDSFCSRWFRPSALLHAATTITPTNHYAYGANVGWTEGRGDVANASADARRSPVAGVSATGRHAELWLA